MTGFEYTLLGASFIGVAYLWGRVEAMSERIKQLEGGQK